MAMQEQIKCTTCRRNVTSEKTFSRFSCPNCGEETITRCKVCKEHSNLYKCSKCEFEGP